MDAESRIEDAGGPPATAEKPDIMNDPAFDTPSANKEKGVEDLDTCRICRGEGSKEEPLFYPCKCSGSIKFVHQNCLIEWLSHSQKKHCELCKTPFHFTKLYSPHMPNSVPPLVFMRQAILHAYRNLLSWSRLMLVIFVWAACLPYCMRSVWRTLFWLGDGGWANWQEKERRVTATAQEYMDNLAATGTTPADLNHFTSRDAAASAVVSHVANVVPSMLAPISSVADYVSGGPFLFRLGKKVIRLIVSKDSNESAHATQAPTAPSMANYTASSRLETRSSLLSNVAFLKSLTRYPKLNKMLIDMFEGQIITLSVVVAFILIFLIREWVVQQQPAMAIAAVANAAALEARVEHARAADDPEDMQPETNLDEVMPEIQPAETDNEDLEAAPQRRQPRVLARARQRRHERLPGPDVHGLPRHPVDPPSPPTTPVHRTESPSEEWQANESTGMNKEAGPSETSNSNHPQVEPRPNILARDALDQAAEIRRTLDENSVATDQKDWPGLKIFTDLWTRAGNKPSEVLQIIDREGRTEELGWIVAAMKRLENDSSTSTSTSTSQGVAATDVEEAIADENKAPLEHVVEDEPNMSISSSSPKENPGSIESQDSESANDIRGSDSIELTFENRPTTPSDPPQSEQGLKEHTKVVPLGLRDISNQQFDGPSDYPAFQETDSDNSFVVLSNAAEPDSPASDLPQENPLHHDSDEEVTSGPAEASGESVDTHELLASLGHQEQDLNRLIEERDTLMRESGGPSEQDDIVDPSNDITNDDVKPPRGYLDRIIDWLWGEPPPNTTRREVDDEHIVEQVEEEAPFVPMAQGRPVFEQEDAQEQNPAPAIQDPEVAAAAAEAGLDPNGVEAVEDAEDLEGIMELVGMQGPLFGLIQNAIFCSVIVGATIGFGVWIPYISGKIFLIFLANPISLLVKMPLRWASTTADILVDFCVFSAGCSFYWIDTAISFVCRPVTRYIPQIAMITEQSSLAEAARRYAESALDRLAKTFVGTGGNFLDLDIPTFSVVAHESLHAIESGVSMSIKGFFRAVISFVNVSSIHELSQHVASVIYSLKNSTSGIAAYMAHEMTNLKASAQSLSLNKVLQVNLTIPQRTAPLDFTLAYWDTKDRTLSILYGYAFFALIGIAYLKIIAFLRGKNASGRVEGSITDVLYQAGGVMKVILIISIEMILFPLFCGLLLDMALLPLFGDATFVSRLTFGIEAPYTSLFIHWFIGTCYMFHFALFVSMCRRIMRTGVLYFIRDPDDPTFHPVRDVLERNLLTQLRKIVFSAVVYGALVMVCLGGVVWGIHYAFDGIFPVYWSSNEPVLEFPVDLLFYNFLMPVAVRFFKPSIALNQVYSWWFRRCARALRLSHFLFGDKRIDEEGRHVRRTWQCVLEGKLGDPSKPVTNAEQRMIQENQGADAYFLRDGRYVRAPASDQVRMPRGTRTFLEVDEHNHRVDQMEDREQGPHGSRNEQFTKVYVPPFFRLRIGGFIFFIWLFAATTGVCTTVVPLVLGRYIFAEITPSHLRMNDIYAFSIGVYVLGGTAYASLFAYKRISHIHTYLTTPGSRTRSLFRRTQSHVYRALRVLYTYTAFTIVLPALFALLIQTYAIIPLHAYLGTVSDRHTIHLVQDWTLGVLYIQAIGRLILFYSPSRPADALRGIVRDGWLDPDMRLATRAFIFPATMLMLFLLALPMTLGWAVNTFYFEHGELGRTLIYRYSAPFILGQAVTALAMWIALRAFQAWRGKIRDEVYLIGERLHNFGEQRKVRRAAGGGRLDVRA